MAIENPWSITYGEREVGGTSRYQIHGPYILDKSYETIRLVFDVVIVGTSYSDLQSLADDFETDFRKRLTAGETLEIDISGSTWTYTHGSTILHTRASFAKSGNFETDKGFSRAYTVTIEGELPADSDSGLRDIEVLVDFEPGRQKIVTMRGTYTATSTTDAVAQYQANFDTVEAPVYLDAADASATWELVDENYTMDREQAAGEPATHVCNFMQQYVELLHPQSGGPSGSLDDSDIRDHRVVFTDLSQHPGDSDENVYRLRRVIGTFDCAIDIDETTNLQTVYKNKVKKHILDVFEANFKPQIFAVESHRLSYDETSKRMSIELQMIYQNAGGGNVVEVSQTGAYRENRQIDYSHVHGPDELAAEADPGFAVVEYHLSQTVISIGESGPRLRIGKGAPVSRDGWNLIQNTSQATPQWIGDPDGGSQIPVTVLSETIVWRYTRRPAGRSVVEIKEPINKKTVITP